MPKCPTRQDIDDAGRQLQRGGLLGRGSTRKADKVIEEAEAAGLDGQMVAMGILSAAADHKPRWRRG